MYVEEPNKKKMAHKIFKLYTLLFHMFMFHGVFSHFFFFFSFHLSHTNCKWCVIIFMCARVFVLSLTVITVVTVARVIGDFEGTFNTVHHTGSVLATQVSFQASWCKAN